MKIPNAVTRSVSRKVLVTQKHAPQLLFAAGITGFVTTVVLASRATLKLEGVLLEAQEDMDKANELRANSLVSTNGTPIYSEADYKTDMTTLYVRSALDIAKLYGPTIIVGALSVTCLAKSHNMLTRRNAALAAAYTAMETSFRRYREKIAEEYGKDRELELYQDLEICEIEDETGKKGAFIRANSPYSPYAKFFDKSNKNWNHTSPDYNVYFLTLQQNYLNDRLKAKGHVFLNEVYDDLGLDRTTAGQIVGWVYGNGDDVIDFGFNGAMRDAYIQSRDDAILLDFNVDGVIYELIGRES